MSKPVIIKVFFGSLIGLAAGIVLLFIAGGLALSNDVFIVNGPDVVGIRSGPLAWTLLGLISLAALVMLCAVVAQFAAWIGAVLNTANLPSKNWLVVLLVVGLLGFVLPASLAYIIAGPDGLQAREPDAARAAPPHANQRLGPGSTAG